jgi:hypothetical protein
MEGHMKLFTVPANTPCRLVKVLEGAEMPFTTRKELLFEREDLVIDPVSVYNQTRQMIEEYGFVHGDAEQRKKYVLVVHGKHVMMNDEE